MQKKYSLLILISIILISSLFVLKYSRSYFSLHGDSMGYYIYLPATFIYHNLKDIDVEPAEKKMAPQILEYALATKAARTDTNQQHTVVQYTYGIALMELPFFLAAHGYEVFTGGVTNGYASSYLYAIFFSGLCYMLLGMFFTYKSLRKYFSHLHSLLALAIILMATHMFWFVFVHIGMSHIPLFFLYSLLVYLSIRLHEKPATSFFILIGFTAGLITIIRPTDVICLLIPLLYGLNSKEALRDKIALIKQYYRSVLLAVVAFVLPIIPQLLYWKMLTGKYFYYSYGNQKFNWGAPKIIPGLFHFNNGWFPYALIMIFAICGFFLYKKYRQLAPVLLVLFPLYIYIIYSWYCYNYINGLGSRPMIHMYPLLAFPLAAFISWVSGKGLVAKTLFFCFCIFSMGSILSFSKLMSEHKFKSEDANFQFYAQMLFPNGLTSNKLLAWDLAEYQPDIEQLKKIKTLAVNNFDVPFTDHYVPDPEDTGYVCHMWEGEEYFQDGDIKIPYTPEALGDAKWIKCSARFMCTEYTGMPTLLVFSVIDQDNKINTWKGCKVGIQIGLADSSCKHTKKDITLFHSEQWKWGLVSFFTKVPKGLTPSDTLMLNAWNQGKKQIFFDDFKIELYK